MWPCSTTFQERRTPQAFTMCAASNGISSPFWRIVPRAMCGLALRLTSVIVIEKLYIVRLPCVSVFKYDILPDIFIISWSKTICTFYNGWCLLTYYALEDPPLCLLVVTTLLVFKSLTFPCYTCDLRAANDWSIAFDWFVEILHFISSFLMFLL